MREVHMAELVTSMYTQSVYVRVIDSTNAIKLQSQKKGNTIPQRNPDFKDTYIEKYPRKTNRFATILLNRCKLRTKMQN